MKIVLLVCLVVGSFVQTTKPVMTEVRALYLSSPDNEKDGKKLVLMLEDIDQDDPLLYGYKGGVNMIMASHVFNPFKKLSYFKKGREMLDEAIEADGKNAELRLLRFGVQTHAPSFLGYNENIEEDKKLLLAALPGVRDPELKRFMMRYLEKSEYLSEQELKQISDL